MKSGRYIGVMSGTSLDGVDVVLAAIDENMVAQQASLTWPIPVSLKEDILSICRSTTDAFAAGTARCAAGGAVCRGCFSPDAQRESATAGCGRHWLSRSDRLA